MNDIDVNKRDETVDVIKAIAIIMVVLGHINFANYHIKKIIYSFHMPLFFFASGLTLNFVEKNSIKKIFLFAKKKFDTLIIPYLIWSLIFCKFSWSNLCLVMYGSYFTIVSSGSLSSLWFLPTMFVSTVIVKLIMNMICKYNDMIKNIMALFSVVFFLFISRLLPDISIGYPLGFNVSLVAAAFMLLGFICKPLVKINVKLIVVIMIVSFALLFFLYQKNVVNDIGYVLMANAQYGDFSIFILVALSGCIFIYYLSFFICKIEKIKDLMVIIGRNTFSIFVLHKPVIEIFKQMFKGTNINSNIQLVTTLLGTMVIVGILTKIINKYVPFLSARKI